MSKKTIRDVNVTGKKVLIRCDFNVPLDENGNITDTTRIDEAIPTIKYAIERGAEVILCSHLGKPKGEVNKKYSLKPVQEYLSKKFGVDVKLANDIVGESAKKLTGEMKRGEIVLLENTRFDPREEKNDREFSKELASLADIYVNDAFGTAHRAHSSTAGVAEFLPAVSGFLMEKELKYLGDALENPERPFVVILGGAKVSDKIQVIENLMDKADKIIIGGGMANTFLRAKGYNTGTSLVEEDRVELAKKLMEMAKEKGTQLVLPTDVVVAKEFSNDSESKIVKAEAIEAETMALDVGPETLKEYEEVLKDSKTIVWNGPLGVFEFEKFAKGTNKIAEILGNLHDVTTIIGGGDSVAAVKKAGYAKKMTHISTGGGASLEFLEGKELPGVACLEDAKCTCKDEDCR